MWTSAAHSRKERIIKVVRIAGILTYGFRQERLLTANEEDKGETEVVSREVLDSPPSAGRRGS